MTELAGTSASVPQHTNVWTTGRLEATYDFANGGLHFALGDSLGTKRIQVSGTGVPELNCSSLPFGNATGNGRTTSCTPWQSNAPHANELHFTGKERDTKSGLDYFGARYYGSNINRWMSPDGSTKEDPIPYAKLDNPQSLNLYSYVWNNPLKSIDPDGHDN